MLQENFKQPLITVITVCYNSSKTIEATLKSVLAQTYQNYEYLIIDGASTDDTLQIVASYEEAFGGRLHVTSEKDSGIYNAMNKGIRKSRGAMVGILNSDDFYSPNTLELVARRYEQEQYPLLVINGDMIRVTEDGEEICRYWFRQEHIDKKCCFGHPSMFAAKAVYDKIGLYDESYKLAADGEWQFRAHEDPQVRYVLCGEVFNHMREGGASDDPKYRWKWFRERARMKMEHNRGSALQIYCQELKSMLRLCVKGALPKSWNVAVYRWLYRKK